MTVERRLGGGSCLGYRLDADAGNALPEKQVRCCRENACSRRDFSGLLLYAALPADVEMAFELLALSRVEPRAPVPRRDVVLARKGPRDKHHPDGGRNLVFSTLGPPT